MKKNTVYIYRVCALNLAARITLKKLDLLIKFDVVRAQFVGLILLQLYLLLQYHHLLCTTCTYSVQHSVVYSNVYNTACNTV